jgi:prepilin-type N-terminal cleavage/methylation domain-containing protein
VGERRPATAGFSLVEVVIAVLILGLIAIALLPALVQGLRFSSEQAEVATATHQLNALIEDGRDAHTCAVLDAVAPTAYLDGAVVPVSDPHDFRVDDAGFVCIPGTVNTIVLTAIDPGGLVLATVTAKVLVDS